MRKSDPELLTDVDAGPEILKVVGAEVIHSTINNGDVDKAKEILSEVLMPVLSDDTKSLLNECMKKIDTYEMSKEWGV